MIALLLALLAARAVPPELLAPDLEALEAHLAKAEVHLYDTRAIGAALGRVQNGMSLGNAFGCASDEARSLAQRGRLLGQAQRDALQSARAELARLQEIARAPTVAPLLTEAQQQRLAAVETGVKGQISAWRTSASWHETYVENWYGSCPTQLQPAEGLPAVVSLSAEELGEGVAVLAAGPGVVCPEGRPAAGGVVVLNEPRACFGAQGCDCEPQAVLPAAVLGRSP